MSNVEIPQRRLGATTNRRRSGVPDEKLLAAIVKLGRLQHTSWNPANQLGRAKNRFVLPMTGAIAAFVGLSARFSARRGDFLVLRCRFSVRSRRFSPRSTDQRLDPAEFRFAEPNFASLARISARSRRLPARS